MLEFFLNQFKRYREAKAFAEVYREKYISEIREHKKTQFYLLDQKTKNLRLIEKNQQLTDEYIDKFIYEQHAHQNTIEKLHSEMDKNHALRIKMMDMVPKRPPQKRDAHGRVCK